jgi:GT2 family glycosyltransferase
MTDVAGGVSIVVPVCNRVAFTYECLQSVLTHSQPGQYEIIVVDDASTDDTPALLTHVDGLRVIRNETTRGFEAACNQSVSQSRGAFLLFLSNDVVVLDGWLDALRDTINRHPSIGAVGPQVLSPDGRLQEAGRIVWNNGTGWNYGRGDDPLRPEYRHVREIDYGSGACLLVRRALMERLSGFDLRLNPEYADADLCFRIRRLGYRVLYQPGARVARHDEATSAAALAADVQHGLALQRLVFVQKHAEALAEQCPPDARFVFRARDRCAGKRVLLVDHAVPQYDQHSGAMRCFAIIRILGELGHKVTVFGDDSMLPEPYTESLRQIGVEVLGAPLSIADYIEWHLADFDLVILCRAPIAAKYLPAILARAQRPPVVLDTVDLHFLREERHAALEKDPALAEQAARLKTLELALARQSNLVWVVSTHEADLLGQEAPTARVEIVPNIHTVRTNVPPFRERQDLMFIGTFLHPPNVDAVLYFVEQIFPRIRREIPGIRFRVVGPDAPPAIRELAAPDVEIVGHVPHVEPLFDVARLSVAPLRYGAGMKGKIGQSLAYGLPVVTTTVGAEGMSLRHREQALIADEPEAFAAAVVELYRDASLWATLSEQGRCHVEAHWGYERIKLQLATIVRRLTAVPWNPHRHTSSPTSLRASVILPTKDRGPAIAETIDSLLRLDYPIDDYEVVIVDNLSSPENQAYLQAIATAHPGRIHYVREENLGLNNARNAGIRHSRGDILAFLDDDAIVPAHWLANIVDAFDADPQVYALGSKVIARFTTSPPDWIDQRLGMYISNFDRGDQPERLFYNEYPRGVNMAIRSRAFEQCGYFLDCFDRKGDSLMSYGDIEICYRIDKAGYTVLYIPNAEVYHLIRGDRLNEAWFRRRFYWQGRSEGLFELLHFGKLHVLRTLPHHVLRSLYGGDHYDRRHHCGFLTAVLLNYLRRTYN